MGKKNTKVVEARTKEERKKVRKSLGTLKSLTVQPQTKARYKDALDKFFQFLSREGLALPKRKDDLDDLVGDYLEYLWSEGEGRSSGSNVLAALQDFDPKLKGHLPSSWRLMKTWTTQEVPNRAPPLPESVIHAMAGWAFFNEHFGFGLSLLVSFYTMLHTGELLSLQAWNVHMTSPREPAVISLGLTKSGKRQGAAESVTLSELKVLKLLWYWKSRVSPHTFLTAKPHVWRDLFSECISKLGLAHWGFRPYSLRRGGAAFWFVKLGSLDRILIMGRWSAVKTAKIYINSGLALLADLQIDQRLLKPFHTVFLNYQNSTPQLEPAQKGRSGGRGKRKAQKVFGGEWVREGHYFCQVLPRRGYYPFNAHQVWFRSGETLSC